MITLAVSKRSEIGKRSKRLVRDGNIPGVVYGPKHEATAIRMSKRDFEKAFKIAGESSIVELTGLGSTLQTLIHEVDVHPVTGVPRHADFYAIEKGAKVEVAVPLVFIGESPAVKAGANLVKVLHELEIEADPINLPQEIEVDIALLANLGDQVHAGDIRLPAGVRLMIDPEEVVLLVQEVEEEVEEANPSDLSGIEVEKKGKEEEAAGDTDA